MKSTVHFTSQGTGFCESILYDVSPPETINAITAVFIAMFGIVGLHAFSLNRINVGSIWRMVFSLFVLNGVSSCMYHLTLQLGWKIADEFTMILAVDLGLYQFFLQTLHELLLNDDIYQYLHPMFSAAMDNIAKFSLVIFFCGHDSARKIDTRMFLKQKVFPALVNWIGFFIMTGCVVSLQFIALDFHSHNMIAITFTLATAGYVILVVINQSVIYRHYLLCSKHHASIEDISELSYSSYVMMRTLIFVGISAALWMGTEPFCHKYKLLAYLHAHALWHIFAGYACYVGGMVGLFYECRIHRIPVHLRRGWFTFLELSDITHQEKEHFKIEQNFHKPEQKQQ